MGFRNRARVKVKVKLRFKVRVRVSTNVRVRLRLGIELRELGLLAILFLGTCGRVVRADGCVHYSMLTLILFLKNANPKH